MDQANSYYEAHKGEVEWRDGDYTVTRTTVWSGPGCHDGCGVLYYTKDGKLEKVEGDPDCPFNQGTLCMRCLEMPEAVNHPDRPTGPLKRAGERGENKWESVTWDEAYDIIEEKVRAIWKDYGAESIACMIGTGRNNCWQIPYLCYAAFGSPNFCLGFLSGESCFQPRSAAMASMNGDFLIADMSQQFESRYDTENTEWVPPEMIVVWGCNPIASNSDNFYGGWVVDCMQRGSRLITVDPSLTWLAARSDYWLRLRPGTDAALALGMMNVIVNEGLYDHEFVDKWCYGFEELSERVQEYPVDKVAEITWVSPEQIQRAARLLANSKPCAMQWGLAVDMVREALPAGQAIVGLFQITGNVDIPGGNIFPVELIAYSGGWGGELISDEQKAKRIGLANYPLLRLGFQVASNDDLLDTLLTDKPYKMRGSWLQTNNAIACMGAQPQRILPALQKMEFNVVVDLFLTPTALACADVLLPAACFAERIGITGHQPYALGAIAQAVEPLGECKSDQRIIYETGSRFTDEAHKKWDDEQGFYDYLLRSTGFTYDSLKERAWAYPEFEYRKYEKGLLRPDGTPGFATSTGRYNFYCAEMAYFGFSPFATYEEPPESPVSAPDLAEKYPLVLTTGARKWGFFHSEHRQSPSMRRLHPDPTVLIHPETAAAYGIADGDWVTIENNFGSCRQKAELTTRIRKASSTPTTPGGSPSAGPRTARCSA